ncbi:hypothetical protein CR513_20118, partial [Mucuna pruriens]
MQVGQLVDTVSQMQSTSFGNIPLRFEIDEDLLKLFLKVEINIPLLEAIKQVRKYVKFFKELYVHKRKKIKGIVETGGIMSTLEESCRH